MEIIGLLLFLWIVGGSTALFGMIGRGGGITPMPLQATTRREP